MKEFSRKVLLRKLESGLPETGAQGICKGGETALQQKLHDRNVKTEAYILTISYGRSLVAARDDDVGSGQIVRILWLEAG